MYTKVQNLLQLCSVIVTSLRNMSFNTIRVLRVFQGILYLDEKIINQEFALYLLPVV